MRFFIIDAFSSLVFGGNPAGVVLLDNDFPPLARMLQTAAELRYSETAFVKALSPGHYHTRYFTPTSEVDVCGHATIAAFHALAEAGLCSAASENQTAAGLLHIEIADDVIYMDMAPPRRQPGPENDKELDELYAVMGAASGWRHIRFRPEAISIGLADILMPVASTAVLDALAPDFAALAALSGRYNVTGVHAFAFGDGGQLHCRNFAPLFGINEEAATGTSNGALTYYLYLNGCIQANSETMFIQGEAMGRPSQIRSWLHTNGSNVQIQVGGQAATLAQGTIFL